MAILNKKLFLSEKFTNELKRIIREGDPLTLTASDIRKELEDKFDLGRKSLKEQPWKEMLNDKIDEYFTNGDDTQQDEEIESHEPKTTIESNKKEEEGDNDNNDASSPEQEADETNDDIKDESPTSTKHDSSGNDNDDGSEDNTMVKSDSDQDEDTAASPPPQKKQRQKKEQSVKQQKQSGKKGTTNKASPDDDTIKRLKSYIHKCGVRKSWQKELAGLETKKSQIKKLKEILEDLGVQGRPTIEKCEAVKAERELKAEIDSLDRDNILETADDGPSLRSSGLSKRKRRHIIQEDCDESGDEQTAAPLDVSFLGNQSDEDSD
ncbi:unnamed protein product [Absidia cylindrospora]